MKSDSGWLSARALIAPVGVCEVSWHVCRGFCSENCELNTLQKSSLQTGIWYEDCVLSESHVSESTEDRAGTRGTMLTLILYRVHAKYTLWCRYPQEYQCTWSTDNTGTAQAGCLLECQQHHIGLGQNEAESLTAGGKRLHSSSRVHVILCPCCMMLYLYKFYISYPQVHVLCWQSQFPDLDLSFRLKRDIHMHKHESIL